MAKVVTRFAPSPTGWLHIGGLRTALFSYLWATKHKGDFRLRIEDTDQERLVSGTVEQLKTVLDTFHLSISGEIIIQSDFVKTQHYVKKAEKLIAKGRAYYCFCSPERLQELRQQQRQSKKAPRYDGRCRNLTVSEAQQRMKDGESIVIRLKLPQNHQEAFIDELRGKIIFDDKDLDDAIILKSDGFPTYHLANVVDDHAMNITHVIRGEEWLPSAPLHGLLYDYLGYKRPHFYHLPLILNSDHSKLSKRKGDAAVEHYLQQGYLTEALINYVAFLGWNPGDEREIFSLAELIKEFDLAKLNKSPAIFDLEKLNWYNAWYIKNVLAVKKTRDIYSVIGKFLPGVDEDRALQIFNLFYSRLHNLSELPQLSDSIDRLPDYKPSLLIFKKSDKKKTKQGLTAANKLLASYKKAWTAINLELALKQLTETENLTFGDVFWPIRVALSGAEKSPSPTELLNYLGVKESLERINQALNKLGA